MAIREYGRGKDAEDAGGGGAGGGVEQVRRSKEAREKQLFLRMQGKNSETFNVPEYLCCKDVL